MKLIYGDCLKRMTDIDDNSIDAIVTNPPYSLEFMGKRILISSWACGTMGL